MDSAITNLNREIDSIKKLLGELVERSKLGLTDNIHQSVNQTEISRLGILLSKARDRKDEVLMAYDFSRNLVNHIGPERMMMVIFENQIDMSRGCVLRYDTDIISIMKDSLYEVTGNVFNGHKNQIDLANNAWDYAKRNVYHTLIDMGSEAQKLRERFISSIDDDAILDRNFQILNQLSKRIYQNNG